MLGPWVLSILTKVMLSHEGTRGGKGQDSLTVFSGDSCLVTITGLRVYQP